MEPPLEPHVLEVEIVLYEINVFAVAALLLLSAKLNGYSGFPFQRLHTSS